MRNFNYTARDKAGATKHGSVQAADRNAALHQLAAQGLVTLSVAEGEASNKAEGNKLSRYVFMIAVALGIIGAAIFTWSSIISKKGNLTHTNSPKIAKQQALKSTKTSSSINTRHLSSINEHAAALIAEQKTQAIVFVSSQNLQTNKLSTGINSETDDALRPQMLIITNKVATNFVFSTRTDMMFMRISRALKMGTPMFIPKDPYFLEDFKETINKDIVLYDTDTEQVAQLKADVARLKEEARKLLNEGYKIEDIFSEVAKRHNNAIKERAKLQQAVTKKYEQGDYKGAEKLADEVNETLKNTGQKPVMVPYQEKEK